VSAVNAPSRGNAGRTGWSGWPMGQRWSKTNTPSRPSSSAWRAAAMAISPSSWNWGRVTPTFTASTAEHHGRPARGSYDSCSLSQLGGHDRHGRTVVRALHQPVEGGAGRREEHVARLHQATSDDDDGGVEDVGQVGQAHG